MNSDLVRLIKLSLEHDLNESEIIKNVYFLIFPYILILQRTFIQTVGEFLRDVQKSLTFQVLIFVYQGLLKLLRTVYANWNKGSSKV